MSAPTQGSGHGAGSASKSPQNGHDVFVSLLGEIIGIAILAVVADFNETIGKVAVALMVGWLLVFLITNDTFLATLEKKL